MKQILLNVKQQKLFLPVNDYIVESSKNYLSLKFNFIDNDWSNCDLVIAVLENYDGKIFKEVLDNENCITVKKQVLNGGYFKVCLRGYNSKIGQTIPTNSVDIPVNYSIYVGQEDLEETTFDQIGNSFVKARLDDYSRIIFTRNNGKELVVQINDTTYFKGEFTSLEQLIEKYPTGEVGEYAYVNTTLEDGDYLIKYTWDADSNSWKEYSTDKYVTSSSFALFKNNLNAQLEEINKNINAVLEVEVESLDKDSVENALKGFSMDKKLALFLHEHNNVIIRVKIRNKFQNLILGVCDFKKSASLCEVFDPQVDNGKFSWMFKFNFTGFVDIAEERYEIIFGGGENQNTVVTFSKRLLALVDGSYGDYTLWGVEKKLNDKIEEKQQKLIAGENIEIGDDGTISAIGGGGVETVEELPPAQIPDPNAPATASSTSGEKLPVPTSGYVEKVYFDTSLSVEEVLENVKNIPLISDFGTPILIAKYEDGSLPTSSVSVAYVEDIQSDGTVGKLVMILNTPKYFDVLLNSSNFPTEEEAKAAMESCVYFYYYENYKIGEAAPSFVGWNPSFNGEIEVNSELTNNLNIDKYFESVTGQNPGFGDMPLYEDVEGLSELFYTKSNIPMIPNPDINQKVIYRVSGGEASTPVPNSGTVEKVYLNTNLTEEEVITELEKLTYDADLGGVSFSMFLLAENQISVCSVKVPADTGVVYIICDLQGVFNNDQSKIFFMSNGGIDSQPYIGWNPDFSGEIEVNNVVISEMSSKDADGNDVVNPVGVDNDKIANLFSLDSTFGGSGSTKYYNFDGESWNQLLTDKDTAKIEVDDQMSDTSTNPVQNKVIKAYVDSKISDSITTALQEDY